MSRKLLSVFLALSILPFASCGKSAGAIRLPEPRPLGNEFELYQPPEKSVVSEESVIEEPDGPLTLRGALALALMRNPGLKAYSWKVRESEAMRLEASLRPNPELGIEVEDAGGTGAKREFDGAIYTIQLSRLIELGGKRGKREKLASLGSEVAGWDYEAQRLRVFTDVTRAFIDLLSAQQKFEFTGELVRLSGELLKTVEKRVDSGKDSPLEKTRAEVTHSNIMIEDQRSARELDLCRRNLSLMWGVADPVFSRAAGDLEHIEPLPPGAEFAAFLKDNPEIARASAEVERQKAALDLEKKGAFPDITVSGGMQRFSETGDNLVVFGISIPFPISNRNQAGKELAGYRLAGAKEIRAAEEARVRSDLTSASSDLSGAYAEAVELRDNVLRGARSVFDASLTSYREGKLDYLHLLDAQRTLFQVRTRYIESLAQYHKAKADLERLIGRPVEDLFQSKSEDE
ncbi:MAG: TolC family protein [Candidatus Krumholzibacteriota bacterium]|nr:TolC family protein [Candidatus Krumholzibacteriota bacterium]